MLKIFKSPKESRPRRDKDIFQGRAIDKLGKRKFSGFRDPKRLYEFRVRQPVIHYAYVYSTQPTTIC